MSLQPTVSADLLTYEDNNIIGAKNFIKYPYTASTYEGDIWRDEGNGVIVSEAITSPYKPGTYTCVSDLELPVGSYILSGCPSGGSSSTYYIELVSRSSVMGISARDYGDGAEFQVQEISAQPLIVRLCFAAADIYPELTWKPMIRIAYDTDDTWVPYAMSNVGLTRSKVSHVDNLFLGVKNLLPLESAEPLRSNIYNQILIEFDVVRVFVNSSGDGVIFNNLLEYINTVFLNPNWLMRGMVYVVFSFYINAEIQANFSVIVNPKSGPSYGTYNFQVQSGVYKFFEKKLPMSALSTISIRSDTNSQFSFDLSNVMLRLVTDDTGDEYQRYAMPNVVLTDHIDYKLYGTTDSTSKIQIAINSTKTWMLCFVVTLFQGYRAIRIMVSGYQYESSYWYEPRAVILGDSGNTPINVYFGYYDTNRLWVGFDGGAYTGIRIDSVTNGNTQLSNFRDLFTISNVPSFRGTTQSTLNVFSGKIPVNPSTEPTEEGSIWLTTT